MKWLNANWDKVIDLLLDHLWLSGLPILLGFLIALPIGWYANRHRRLRGFILSVSGILYTIPSLAFFLILPSIIGTGFLDPINVVVALTVYAVAIMVRSSADAFESVAPAVLDAATASGFSAVGRAFRVELPLAGPVLLAGLRVVAVSTVSLVSVGALIGVSNLGSLFTEGYRTDNNPEILTGVVGIVAVALLFDALLVLAGRLLMPWVRAARTPTRAPISVRLRSGRA
ncbi:osmoprotectant transport system permease protein [Aeromicrobium panaciterrae]|uniref:Osmoprotectant transport system permease protein n=1 Tax=Aeromicrobium panaciterrae TaxID=363861 RepID=A0ABU1UL10_9ACTN|nr:ABC transporter permease [Aeromicrobium panaciterrae]MDR7085856.1 osmoprotectant transport system permease protein [Aeromicrobium panaciterrae]